MNKAPLVFAIAAALCTPVLAGAQTSAELDAFWANVSRTIDQGDFEGYAGTYHPDAILVVADNTTMPIADALAGWKQGFDDTKAGRADADVTFRFTGRLHDATTAHETGMFRYRMVPDDGEDVDVIVHFEALLVKRDGRWLMLMEYQKDPATEEEWDAAR